MNYKCMNPFEFTLPTKIIFGPGCVKQLPEAIREIGGIAELYGVKETAYETFCQIWTQDHLGRQVEIIPGSAKPGWLNVKAWKGSSDFDSAQMARFIDSLIQDAESLGIPTVPDKEVERMVSQWGKPVKALCNRETPDATSAAAG
jgi:hypothetical protein